MIKPPTSLRHINDLQTIMDGLLSPEGCPWDREQTPESITPNVIEEAHELAEAIERKDIEAIKEELGDLLLQVVFQSALAKRLGRFGFDDVVESISSKLVRRHPHVFGDTKAGNAEEALKSWTDIKKDEKKSNSSNDIFAIPQSLPALQRAQKIGSKTKTLKFDWDTTDQVFEKVEEEFGELKDAYKAADKAHTEEELGDLFFALAQLARHLKLEAETVARKANRKFEDRFKKLLEEAHRQNLKFENLTLEHKERLWQQIKKK